MINSIPEDLYLLDRYLDNHPREVIQAIESADPEDAAAVLNQLDLDRAVKLLERFTPGFAAALLPILDEKQARQVIEAMDPGHTATLLGHLDEEQTERLLGLAGAVTTSEIKELMSYPPDTAGALMDTRVATFAPTQTVREALVQLQRDRIESEELVVVDGGRLLGMVRLATAVASGPETLLSELLSKSPIYVLSTAPREDVATLIEQANLTVLPVVDPSERLLGCINHRALVRAIREDATVDLQTLVGVSKEERALSSPWFAVRKRLPWLNINLVTAFAAAFVVGMFEDTIAKFTALAVLLPVVAGQSGNTGAQALAVTMRGLALREIRLRHSLYVLGKEGLAGILNGIAIAVVTCIGVYLWSGSAGLVLVIGLAMVISMAIAGLSGAGIPLLLSAFRQDPAQSGSIVLTTVTDIVGFFSFLGLATIFASLL